MSFLNSLRLSLLTLATASFGLVGCEQDFDAPMDEDLSSGRQLTSGVPTPPSNPSLFVAAGKTLFFIAESADSGLELWKSDGTGAGTALVKDINPGPDGTAIQSPTPMGNQLFFLAYNNEGSHELWTSDGSETGTYSLTSLRSSIDNLEVMGGELYFIVSDSDTGAQLWKSDGTVLGTKVVMDTFPSEGATSPAGLTAMGGKLYFAAYDAEHGYELWVSEGTAETTRLVKDVFPGQGGGVLGEFVVAGQRLFFIAEDGVHSYELWTSDGTEAGTRMVKDIGPGEAEAHLGWLVPMGSILFFHADDGKNGLELWKSDGTEKGTVMVKNINGGLRSSEPRGLVVADNQLYFFGDYGSSSNTQHGLFKSNGTSAGTTLVRGNLQLGYNWFAPPFITAVGSAVYFNVTTTRTGAELWNATKKSWSSMSVAMVKDINPGAADSNLGEMVSFNGKLYFSADDGVHGNELWMSNGTSSGTVLVKDINL